MKNILIRAASGAVYVALIIFSVLYGGYWAFPTLCGFFTFIGIMEFQRMAQTDFFSSPQSLFVDLLIGLLLITVTAADMRTAFDSFIQAALIVIICVLVFVRLIMQLYSHRTDAVKHLAYSLMSIFYVAVPLVFAITLFYNYGPAMMLLVFIMIWLNDTGAFLVGTALGSHHLFKRLSPKKSWEGFVGGLCFCIAAGYLARPIAPEAFSGYTDGWLVGLGALVCAMSTWGDLFESMIKRNFGVKDSGNILPGHGGILDRIDSLLFVAPAVVLFLLCREFITAFTIIQGY